MPSSCVPASESSLSTPSVGTRRGGYHAGATLCQRGTRGSTLLAGHRRRHQQRASCRRHTCIGRDRCTCRSGGSETPLQSVGGRGYTRGGREVVADKGRATAVFPPQRGGRRASPVPSYAPLLTAPLPRTSPQASHQARHRWLAAVCPLAPSPAAAVRGGAVEEGRGGARKWRDGAKAPRGAMLVTRVPRF